MKGLFPQIFFIIIYFISFMGMSLLIILFIKQNIEFNNFVKSHQYIEDNYVVLNNQYIEALDRIYGQLNGERNL